MHPWASIVINREKSWKVHLRPTGKEPCQKYIRIYYIIEIFPAHCITQQLRHRPDKCIRVVHHYNAVKENTNDSSRGLVRFGEICIQQCPSQLTSWQFFPPLKLWRTEQIFVTSQQIKCQSHHKVRWLHYGRGTRATHFWHMPTSWILAIQVGNAISSIDASQKGRKLIVIDLDAVLGLLVFSSLSPNGDWIRTNGIVGLTLLLHKSTYKAQCW